MSTLPTCTKKAMKNGAYLVHCHRLHKQKLTLSFSCVSRTVLPSAFFLQLWLSLRKNLTALRSNRNKEPPDSRADRVVSAIQISQMSQLSQVSVVNIASKLSVRKASSQLIRRSTTWWVPRRRLRNSQVECGVMQEHVTNFGIFQPAASAFF